MSVPAILRVGSLFFLKVFVCLFCFVSEVVPHNHVNEAPLNSSKSPLLPSNLWRFSMIAHEVAVL